jgi:hypothetical protein
MPLAGRYPEAIGQVPRALVGPEREGVLCPASSWRGEAIVEDESSSTELAVDGPALCAHGPRVLLRRDDEGYRVGVVVRLEVGGLEGDGQLPCPDPAWSHGGGRAYRG